MMTRVQELLITFEQFTESEKRELVVEILRRSAEWDWPQLTDQQLDSMAEERFLELDQAESTDE